MSIKFISIDERLPVCGEPVILKISGVVQCITYIMNGSGDCFDRTINWFEPNFFKFDDDMTIKLEQVESWIYIDDLKGL